ncbi:MAG: hypothetical protein H6813_02625 [Phycisphaeraceae bacterium]|nr:hypothetical protein [Phycisphaeraceae bacterium]MCB9848789.1 hypothetical protein [Phycisphaeraceae bacterium]
MSSATPLLLFQTAQDIVTGGTAWSNPGNALAEDSATAQSGPVGLIVSDPSTNTLRLRDSVIDSPPPEGFTLLGVEVEVRGRWTGNSSGTRSVLVAAHVGGVVRQDLGSGSLPLNLNNSFFKGGPTDTMGLSEADALNPAFGFQIIGTSTSTNMFGNSLLIDVVRWRFYWETAGGSGQAGRSRTRTRGALTRGVQA